MKKTPRHAFTLVELLIVIIAISILAGLSLAALASIQQSAAEVRTRATITKIHRILMEKYVSYADRRVPVDLTGLDPKKAAAIRLQAIRELQLIEMPDHWQDIKDASTRLAIINANENASYLRIQAAIKNHYGSFEKDENGVYSAELLYLIVMAQPGAAESFSGLEIGDTNNNGLKEFVDGWGRPIFYIRWPAGFLPTPPISMRTDLQTGDAATEHDPFDVLGLDPQAYALYPLVYSAGADGQRGLIPSRLFGKREIAGSGKTSVDPYIKGKDKNNKEYQVGEPGEGVPGSNPPQVIAGEKKFSYDNITNHTMD